MNSLKLGLPAQAILLTLLLAPAIVQAQSGVSASTGQGLKFKPATMGTQEPVPAQDTPSGFFPTYKTPPTLAQTGPIPTIQGPLSNPNQQQTKSDDDKDKVKDMAQQLMQSMGGGGLGSNKGLPNRNTNFDSFEYPDDYVFNSGSKGVGNIGNGLCTAKNENRSQVKLGYCQMLNEILNDPNSCANRAMNQIIEEAGPNGDSAGFGDRVCDDQGTNCYRDDLKHYCSTYSSLTDPTQRSLVFLQILSGLIVQESGWEAKQIESVETKGKRGKGLFQIGTDDVGKDRDCAALNDSSIFDPKTNMKCGSCLALKNLAHDHTMGHGVGDRGARGIARYFGPFRDGQSNKREAIAVGANSYCVASTSGGAANMRAAVDGAPQRSTAAQKN